MVLEESEMRKRVVKVKRMREEISWTITEVLKENERCKDKVKL